MRKMVLCIIAQMALHYINRARRWTPVILCTLCGSGDAFSFGSAPAPVAKGEQYKINLKFIHLQHRKRLLISLWRLIGAWPVQRAMTSSNGSAHVSINGGGSSLQTLTLMWGAVHTS